MVSQNLGVVLVPPLLYFIYHKHYLNDNELTLLLISTLLAVVAGIGGWIAQLTYLTCIGYHNLTLLLAARSTQLFRNSQNRQPSHSVITAFFTVSPNQLKLLVYIVLFWIAVKLSSLKSVSFDMGGGTFVKLMGGWNCTLNQFWGVYAIWLLLTVASVSSCLYLLAHDKESDNLYKLYLLKYKLIWDLTFLTFITAYNLWAHQHSSSLSDCLAIYHDSAWARCIWFWGVPASTIWFFYQKQGRFREVSSDQTQNQNELEHELNAMQIEREFREQSGREERVGERGGRDGV